MSYAPSAALSSRLQAVRLAMAERAVDALVVTSLPNVFYLTNFTGSAGILVVRHDEVRFITDFRYATVVGELGESGHGCPGLELCLMTGSYDATLASVVSACGRVGVEAAHMTVERHSWLAAALAKGGPAALVSTVGLVEGLRVRKDEYEVATLREAARRLSGVAVRIIDDVRRGRTEREVAMTIDHRVREAGFSAPAFETIVASGPNAAQPHAKPGERILSEGDLVVLDFGGVYDSYCVDLTRTVSIGAASGRARDVYGAVRDAHDRAIAAVAPGRSPFEIDQAARDTLAERGLGEAFGHGTGHGLGIEVHEGPRIARRRPDVDIEDPRLLAGMVFTIEPGAYVPGWGGVRIEDDVLVTDTGVEVLTDATTELIEIGF